MQNSTITNSENSHRTGLNTSKYKSFDDLPLSLRVEQVADCLGIARGIAYALVRSGRIRSIRVSANRLIVPKEAVIEFLNSAS